MLVKYRSNKTFLETRKVVESYVKDNTYATVTQKVSSIRCISKIVDLSRGGTEGPH